jgi:hypothetical protein
MLKRSGEVVIYFFSKLFAGKTGGARQMRPKREREYSSDKRKYGMLSFGTC